MSFASRAREEIAQRSLQKDCCVRAAAYGFACFAKYFDKGGLVLQTEQPHTVQLARELFARCGVVSFASQTSRSTTGCGIRSLRSRIARKKRSNPRVPVVSSTLMP